MTVRRRQELYLDAIEESISMAKLAYARLRQAVILQSSDAPLTKEETEFVTTEMLSQSWLLVDASNRLRVCVRAMPGLRRTPAVESVIRATEPVLPLRNYVQHLDTSSPEQARSGRPLWGTFRYVVVRKADASGLLEWAVAWFIPGRLAVGPVDGAFRIGQYGEVTAPVDHITLAVGDDEADLSAVASAVVLFGGRFQAAVAATPWADDPEHRTIFEVLT